MFLTEELHNHCIPTRRTKNYGVQNLSLFTCCSILLLGRGACCSSGEACFVFPSSHKLGFSFFFSEIIEPLQNKELAINKTNVGIYNTPYIVYSMMPPNKKTIHTRAHDAHKLTSLDGGSSIAVAAATAAAATAATRGAAAAPAALDGTGAPAPVAPVRTTTFFAPFISHHGFDRCISGRHSGRHVRFVGLSPSSVLC